MEDIDERFSLLSTMDKISFLAATSSQLTVYGRTFETDLTGDMQILAYRGLNELQHLISGHIGNLCGDHPRYPDDVFMCILQERSTAYRLQTILKESLSYARRDQTQTPSIN